MVAGLVRLLLQATGPGESRIFSRLCACYVQISIVLFLPESPRYLISKGRTDKAFDILTKYHAEGDHGSVIVRAEIAQIEKTIKIELAHPRSGTNKVRFRSYLM
ncbi:hypothetical protein P175DRAFT_0554593 [Aspergillus ochraceoroseus IBT 24754]|uniref:Major facilitator superfamily (MFS) profile domain-containing protein n=1 Tax=Aspergillus ochraceoroseus IBT 24754 TaxID=1392256 RepID=A0A2T5M9Y8_9EURO|nr:uncharacterized protein P175DRAFT_0554593 [Aspergillus ochraceoroseus IBT 24754]PTU25344.1 hypothetical protein P175DRAFT_0554593 [Aspergillus ochraceoroseus IBT 24754]